MTVIKCKMCGGELVLSQDRSIAECEYCGSLQTVPRVDDERKLALFARAEQLRKRCEFDKAAGVYESIVSNFPGEAEAYWGLLLCRYGIEYVDDPATGKKVPTCHRTVPGSILDSEDLQAALSRADGSAAEVYRAEAQQIGQLQAQVMQIVSREEPYDIFICYKETDDDTLMRTDDSADAQDLYTELTRDGYRVFFARSTLRSKAGSEYEPYIYAALSSAKVMLLIGSKEEYFNAVWVRNEWSRFLAMAGQSGKKLIPCLKGLDPYDMPRELRDLQALDMDDMMFYPSLTEQLQRLIRKDQPAAAAATTAPAAPAAPATASLLRRAELLLEEENWNEAQQYCHRVLDIEPENAAAYLREAMALSWVRSRDRLEQAPSSLLESTPWRNALRFADPKLREELEAVGKAILRREKEERDAWSYASASRQLESATSPESFREAARLFRALGDYRDAPRQEELCLEKADRAEKLLRFDRITDRLAHSSQEPAHRIAALREAVEDYTALEGLPEAEQAIDKAQTQIRELTDLMDRQRREQEAIWDANWDSYVHRARNEQLPYPLEELAGFLDGLGDYRDAPALAALCRSRAEQIRTEEAKLLQKEREREDAIRQKRMRKNRKTSVSMLVTGLLLWIVGGVLMLESFAPPGSDMFSTVFSLILLLLTGAVIQLPPVLLTFLGLTLSSHGKRGGGLCVTGLVLSILGFLGCGLLTALTGMMSYAEPDGAQFLPIFYGLVAYTLTHIATTVHAALHKRV